MKKECERYGINVYGINVKLPFPLDGLLIVKAYNLVEGGYASAQGILRERYAKQETYPQRFNVILPNGQIVIRPPTMADNLEFRLQYPEFWLKYLDSCDGLALPEDFERKGKKKGHFKIIVSSFDRLSFPSDFNQKYVPIDYNQVQGLRIGEFDSREIISNELLDEKQFREHAVYLWWWGADLVNRIADTFYGKMGKKQGFRFWLLDSKNNAEERTLFVDNICYDSDVNGYGRNDVTRFVQVTQYQILATGGSNVPKGTKTLFRLDHKIQYN